MFSLVALLLLKDIFPHEKNTLFIYLYGEDCSIVYWDCKICLLAITNSMTNGIWRFKCCIHKGSPTIPTLNRINPVPCIDTHFFKIHYFLLNPWVPVTAGASLRDTDGRVGFQVWRSAWNILNKRLRTADQECPSSIRFGMSLTTSHSKNTFVQKHVY